MLANKQTDILNVAEMLLHGFADNEILDIWLKSIDCQEYLCKFVSSGYDMPTISRVTPQDLTAIGVTDPAKRQKIITEIKKLNLQDGLPNFEPMNLKQWLSLLRLDREYYESLCRQEVDTIDKLCQLTWEDYEELGIVKLGHQKRLMLAVEKLNEFRTKSRINSSKTIAEPIYDTNPNQIVLVAPAENHTVNGPIIPKRSSTSELSSIESGSIHSIYSAVSSQQRSNHTPVPELQPLSQQSIGPLFNGSNNQMNGDLHCQNLNYIKKNSMNQINQLPLHNKQFSLKPNVPGPHQLDKRMICQSINQMPFNIAKLPKHQQMLLQQSSIYATLTRQPQRVRQPPPPVPVRTNSLSKDSFTNNNDFANMSATLRYDTNTVGINTPVRLNRTSQGYNMGSNSLLQKNKSFSGNAYMDAFRQKYLDANIHSSDQIRNDKASSPMDVAIENANLKHEVQTMNQAFMREHLQSYNKDDSFLTNNNIRNSPLKDTKTANTTNIVTKHQSNLTRSISNGSDDRTISENLPFKPAMSTMIHESNSTTSSTNSSSYHSSDSISIPQLNANVTTGKDEEFPMPPSPLASSDTEIQWASEVA